MATPAANNGEKAPLISKRLGINTDGKTYDEVVTPSTTVDTSPLSIDSNYETPRKFSAFTKEHGGKHSPGGNSTDSDKILENHKKILGEKPGHSFKSLCIQVLKSIWSLIILFLQRFAQNSVAMVLVPFMMVVSCYPLLDYFIGNNETLNKMHAHIVDVGVMASKNQRDHLALKSAFDQKESDDEERFTFLEELMGVVSTVKFIYFPVDIDSGTPSTVLLRSAQIRKCSTGMDLLDEASKKDKSFWSWLNGYEAAFILDEEIGLSVSYDQFVNMTKRSILCPDYASGEVFEIKIVLHPKDQNDG